MTGEAAERDVERRGKIVLRRGVPAGAQARVAELYWEAFGRKLGPALNPPESGKRFIATHLNRDRGVVALIGDEVVGVAGYQLGGRALTGGTAASVLSAYGPFRGVPRLAVLALFSRTPAPEELVMDGLAVDASCRGRGIGSLLLREMAALATDHGCRRIRLDVIDANQRARALYERHGFLPVRTERTPYLRGLLGFGAVTTMHRLIETRASTGTKNADLSADPHVDLTANLTANLSANADFGLQHRGRSRSRSRSRSRRTDTDALHRPIGPSDDGTTGVEK
ncbi:GNAT family N-acetyltransferase [Streptomyces albipurpureus]|uniref:GNAT family N-acetyltransferase n=1 Tax=Streptomyces albipurpureus TaxID=2897419 RepID=A0ABT0UVE2_9ACTN|nr:GNAT family N-acetyltransferase [Streptomyces sp. CWNU-1]MCM2392542.1 GNAT family N-acetyltransferase [Streptomyces sp. CWNU-1]